ncbi:sensor histidine kinase [Streptomyces sp. NPDC092295]|uniref:sensor histidine kinase n=1 Tax=Streptomyces sp. NPDC092295 TaxID=3366011 RepID=UPI00382A572D
MSQLRAPVARPERREGGRHGRPGSRPFPSPARTDTPTPPDARIRPQLLRTAVLPAIVAALSGAAAVVLILRSTAAEPTVALWTALFGMALLAFAAIAAAALGAERTAKSVLDRCNAMRRSSARGQAELLAVVEQLRRGERVPVRPAPAPPAVPGGDEFDLLAQELGRSRDAAVAAVVQASRLSSSVGDEQKVEVFVNLARRLQSLVHREIQLLDELENEVEDPELLKGLFHVDHLATRIRRHAENLAVLGGAISRRQWSRPVTMTEVLRSAIAEVEQYPRIKLVPPIDGTLRGHAVADVIHLLAELVENATVFSSPHTQVLLRAQHVTAGLAIEVEDRGLGMPFNEQKKMNGLLTDPDQVNVAHLLQDGRIGLFVVSALARRHGIAVRLQSNIYGGIQAVLVLPQALLGSDGADRPDERNGEHQTYGTRPQSPPPSQPSPSQPSPSQSSRPQMYEAQPQPPSQQPQPPSRPSQSPQPPLPQQPPPPQPGPTPPLGAPAPLPVRDAGAERPTPAAARPGAVHPDRRRPPAAPDPARPRVEPLGDGTIHATASRPQLPRRRGQEHMVPQLREAPPPPPSAEEAVLHDPGLMAAFQRGIGLAESQPVRPSASVPDPLTDPLTGPSTGPLPDPLTGPLPDLLPAPLSESLAQPPEPRRHDTTPKE